ncbi:MAG: ABC transporter permease [Phycisphaerales bacterium]
MTTLWQDVRYGVRMLRRNPGFTIVAVLTLALGIGANTAIFSLLDLVLFRPLPVAHPQQLAAVQMTGPYWGNCRGASTFSYPMYRHLENENEVCDGIVASFATEANLAHAGATEQATILLVSGNYFRVLGLGLTLGRPILPEDDRTPGAGPVLVLSYDFWRRRFGGDERILNQTISVNQQPFTVIGVAPRGFRGTQFGAGFDAMTPIAMKAQVTPSWSDLDDRRSLWLTLVGRLKRGVNLKQAETQLTALYQQSLAEEAPTLANLPADKREWFVKFPIMLAPAGTGRSPSSQQMQTPLFVQMVMVGLVLLIACANVASLLTARSTTRQKEIAMRLALGASRRRIVRQMLVEGMLLALGGGLLGLALGDATARPLAALLPYGAGAGTMVAMLNVRVLAFALGAAALTALLFGFGPALLATRSVLAVTLRDQSASLAGGRGLRRFFRVLVAGQMAVSLVLLIACLLFGISLYRLQKADPGFPTQRLIAFSLDPSTARYRTGEALALHERLTVRLAQLPGVRSASVSSGSVLRGSRNMCTVKFEGSDETPSPDTDQVGPGYFATMGIPVVLGREFNEQDVRGGPAVAIINEAAAQKHFPNQNPLGRHIYFGPDPKGVPDVEIVGVVKAVRTSNIRGEIAEYTFRPLLQAGDNDRVTYYLRTTVDSASLAGSIREAVHAESSHLPVFRLTTVEDEKNRLFAGDRMLACLTAAFGVLATVLAALGLYGVLSYTVARRTREIGIRMALGAGQSKVFLLVLCDALLLTGIGAAIALPVAYGTSGLIASLLYGISAFEIGPFLIGTALLIMVALLASYLPARRAARIDPMVALRQE